VEKTPEVRTKNVSALMKELKIMKNSKTILGCLIGIIFATLATVASATWMPLTSSVTVSSLQNGGSLDFGDKEISDFDMFGFSSGGALAPNPNEMLVEGGQDSVTGDYGLRFFGFSWVAVSGQDVGATFSFKISVLPDYDDAFIKDVSLDLSGAGARGLGGIVTATENVRDSNGNVIASIACSSQDGDGGIYLVDRGQFAPVKEICINSKDISVMYNGTGPGFAQLSEFYEYYSQVQQGPPVPEPTTLVLLGTAGVWFLTRKKRKSFGAYKSK
jgi:hypothetical protein